jgi:hypothetical protein
VILKDSGVAGLSLHVKLHQTSVHLDSRPSAGYLSLRLIGYARASEPSGRRMVRTYEGATITT